jgi:hypothetical protein
LSRYFARDFGHNNRVQTRQATGGGPHSTDYGMVGGVQQGAGRGRHVERREGLERLTARKKLNHRARNFGEIRPLVPDTLPARIAYRPDGARAHGSGFSARRREAFSMRTDNNLAQLALIRSGAGFNS